MINGQNRQLTYLFCSIFHTATIDTMLNSNVVNNEHGFKTLHVNKALIKLVFGAIAFSGQNFRMRR